jgi:hypothetical protein
LDSTLESFNRKRCLRHSWSAVHSAATTFPVAVLYSDGAMTVDGHSDLPLSLDSTVDSTAIKETPGNAFVQSTAVLRDFQHQLPKKHSLRKSEILSEGV